MAKPKKPDKVDPYSEPVQVLEFMPGGRYRVIPGAIPDVAAWLLALVEQWHRAVDRPRIESGAAALHKRTRMDAYYRAKIQTVVDVVGRLLETQSADDVIKARDMVETMMMHAAGLGHGTDATDGDGPPLK